MHSVHPAFSLLRRQSIPSLNLTVEEYEHIATGASHIHLDAANPENVFLVALRTVPKDSTGVAHILEHTVLCGSERYPVRDPFFMMTRRSLNTFMNAFTSSDWTAYPFASINRKDFNNLLDVYLDAVFFARLDPLDFAQEGHRLEFTEMENPQSALMYKGVVFNEMKGAMSSVTSMLWHTLNKYLHPNTTYHHNSGGEPACITDLTYAQLKDFYKSHYHPSNAIFMTYGDIPAHEHQEKFEAQALRHFKRLDKFISVPDEKRFFSPIRVEETYPLAESESPERKTHIILGWLLGKSTDLTQALGAQLLASVLLDNSACPLMQALESTDLGNAPSPMCGLDDSQKEQTFICGLEGCNAADVDKVEHLIVSTLEKIAADGIPAEDIEAALHQLELHQREIGGDSYPYGLQIILNGLTAATHRGDPVVMLDVDSALSQLREAIKDPEYIKKQIHSLLLDNQHRVRLTLVPDKQVAKRRDQAEVDQLLNLQARLNEEEKIRIIEQSKALIRRQAQQDDETILPKVTLEDVPVQESHLEPVRLRLPQSQQPLSVYDVGSNGLVYQQIVLDLPPLSESQLQRIGHLTNCMTEVGLGALDYLAVQRWQARVTGGLNAFSSLRSHVDDVHQTHNFLTLSGKALIRNQKGLCELMAATFEKARYDEHARIRELMAQTRAAREQSVTNNGHALAMAAATSGICAAARLSHELGGLEGIRRLKALDDSLNDKAQLQAFCSELEELHGIVTNAPRRFLLIGEPDQQSRLRETFQTVFDNASLRYSTTDWQLPLHQRQVREAWLTNSQVNYCAQVFPTVPMIHEDAAPLVVLGNVLRNGYLHRAVREQGGAYGGGASQDNNSAAFRFYSYRDPRLEDTLADFHKSVEWVLNTALPWQTIEEAILGAVSAIDKPDSPAGKAKRLFHAELNGRTLELRQAFRERLLATTADDLQRVAAAYLKTENSNIAVVADHGKRELLSDLGLEIQTL